MGQLPVDEKASNLPIPGRYRHFKGGEYEVIDIAIHSETEELMVVYRPCYGERKLWVRPLALFNQPAETEQGIQPRFALIPEQKSN